MEEKITYLDNAATSWPKPPEVLQAMGRAMQECGGNPGRGGHRLALAAGELLYECRENVASFFGAEDAFRVSFNINVTAAINMLLLGFLNPGDHVLVSPMEHNAVMRPLKALTQKGIVWETLPAGDDGLIDVTQINNNIRTNTRLIIVCHESNVNGLIQPIRQIGTLAHAAGVFFMTDCAQSGGQLPVHIEKDQIDFLAFTGHKALLGPTGTGGIILGNKVDASLVRPLIRGGTGSHSESYDQPTFLPDRFEPGTQNTIGLAGLNASVQWIKEQTLEKIMRQETLLMNKLIEGLEGIRGIRLYMANNSGQRGAVLSLTIDNLDNGVAAEKLDKEFGVLTRIGLHCSPLAHRTLGTFPVGTIRFAVSPFTTEEDIVRAIQACEQLAGQR